MTQLAAAIVSVLVNTQLHFEREENSKECLIIHNDDDDKRA